MSRITLALLAIGICCIGACGGSGGDAPSIVDPGATPPPAPDPTGLWITSDAGEGLQAYRAKLSTTSAGRNYAMADAGPGPESADGGFSTTYTLEAGIDESDIVKYDGSVLAVAPSRSACCFILEEAPAADVMPPEPGSEAAAIRLFTTDPDAGAARLEGAISLTEGLTAEGMYLHEETLHVLLSTAWWGTFGPRYIEPG